MRKKGNLHALIQSLTPSERRHFRLYARAMGSDKNYLVLFDALLDQEEFDETALKLRFKDREFARQLHVTKNYLSKHILRSLRQFHARISKDAELKDQLREVELLFHKELLDQCHHALKAAEKIGLVYERFKELAEIQVWKRKLLLARSSIFQEQETLQKLLHKEAEYLEQALQVNRYWQLMLGMYQKGLGNPESVEMVLNHSLITDETQASSIQTKVIRQHLLFAAHSVSNRQKEGNAALDELITLLEGHPDRIRDDPSSYITALNNRVGMLIFNRRTAEVPPLLAKIREVPEKYNLPAKGSIERKLLLRTYNIELELYRDTQQVEQGLALIEVIESFISVNKSKIQPAYVISFHYQFAYLHFQAKAYNASLRWIHQITNTAYGEVRTDIQSYARLLNLIIHYELNNIIVLKYAVDSCRRFLKKKRDLQVFEQHLLRFFSRICMAGLHDYPALFQELYTLLFEADAQLVTASTLDYLDFKSWIEGHLPKQKGAKVTGA
ncbi:MAG: hypothetical protein ACFB10_08360 [Salibacteraceae bacterium]